MKAMESWERKSFKELGLCIRGVSYNPDNLRLAPDKNNVTLLRSNNIRDGRLNFNNLQYVDIAVVRGCQKMQNGDIAICMSNGNRALVGKTGQFIECGDGYEYTVGAFCSIFRPRDDYDLGFIRYLFGTNQYQRQLDGILAGSAINNLKGSDIESLIALVPKSKPEQTKIAEILSTVDRAIEQTEALIAKQQRIKTGLMQDLLTRGIDENGNLRSEQTHKFKDSPLGRIPVEWEVLRLRDSLLSINQGWSPDCDSDPASAGEWGVLKTTAVVWQGYSDGENKALPERLKPRPALEITSGDLLMTRAGPNSRVGVVAYVYSTRDKLMLSDKIYRLIPTENMDGRFLCYVLSGFETQKHLSNLKTGMAESQTNISQKIVMSLLIVVPTKQEQAGIADIIDQMSNVNKMNVETLCKLRSLKTALMQDLLTGRKRVTPLLKEMEEAIG